MTQNALDAYAMANGYGKATQEMSEAEKVALRYAFVQDQLTAATGDFARTSGGWANQVRVMKLQFDGLKATIGQGLINIFTPVLKVINSLLGRLSTLANAFKSFTELITGNKSSGKGSGISDLSGTAADASAGLTDAAGSAENLEDNTSGVGKAAKKAAKDMKALMGFDAVNKLSDNSSDNSGDEKGASGSKTPASSLPVSSGLGSNVDYGSLASGETAVDKLAKKFEDFFDRIKTGVQPTVDALKRLWNEGLAKLGDFAWTALKDFYNGFLVPVGKWVFGEGIPRFVDALNNGLMKIDFAKINDALKNLWDALTPFAINIGEGLLWFWENVLVPLGTWTANEVVPRFLETLTNVIDVVNKILEALQPLFGWFWENVLQPIAEWTGGLFLSIWDGINEALGKFADWCSKNPETVQNIAIIIGSFFAAWKITSFISGIVDMIAKMGGLIKIVQGIGGLIGTVLNPWTLAIAAVIAIGILVWKNWDTIKAKAIEIWGSIKDWFDKTIEAIKGFFTGLWKGIKETFANVGGWFQEKFTAACSNVKKAFTGVGKFFGDVWKGITKAFGNIAGWFKEKFSAAWEAVKKVFSKGGKVFDGIKDGILNGLKAVINGLIDGINTIVAIPFKGINSALDALRNVSIAGFEPFTWLPEIPTPEIPHLAKGGYVKPNTPQLAMIGDNRHQGEVVAPEDKLLEMAVAAANAAGTSGISRDDLESVVNNAVMRIVSALASIGFYLDGEDIAKAQKLAQTGINRRFNAVDIG